MDRTGRLCERLARAIRSRVPVNLGPSLRTLGQRRSSSCSIPHPREIPPSRRREPRGRQRRWTTLSGEVVAHYVPPPRRPVRRCSVAVTFDGRARRGRHGDATSGAAPPPQIGFAGLDLRLVMAALCDEPAASGAPINLAAGAACPAARPAADPPPRRP